MIKKKTEVKVGTYYLDDDEQKKQYEKLLSSKCNDEIVIHHKETFKVKHSDRHTDGPIVTETTRDRLFVVVEYSEEKI